MSQTQHPKGDPPRRGDIPASPAPGQSVDSFSLFGFDLPEDEWDARVHAALQPDDAHSSEPLVSERVGERVGPYELLEVVGNGGMGTVWRARRADKHPDRVVALKLVRRGMDSQSSLRRFRLEEQVLARLEHPNIARLYDGGATVEGRPFFVMEYVEGSPIDAYAEHSRLTVEQRLELFLQVCDAVRYAHGSLVLHRDIKPSHVVVTENGAPKLLDFGIAKILDDDSAVGITATDARVLTPRYASPEQVRGDRLTTATDIYSLGVVLYELLTGGIPYHLETGTRGEVERAVLEQEVQRPSVAVVESAEARRGDHPIRSARLRGDLDTILMTALQKDPVRRYASVELLAADIDRHLRGLPISAAPDSLTYRASRFVRRNKGLVAGVFTAVLALIAATVVAATFAVRESRARADAEQRTRVAESINAFLNEDLLSSVDPSNTDNPNLTVREALDRAAERIEERFSDQPLVEAAIRHTIGEAYRGLRLPRESVPHLRRAVQLREGLMGGLEEETRQAMRDLVSGLYECDQGEEGFAVGEKLLALDIEAVGSDSANAMDTRHLLIRYGGGGGDGDIETTNAALRSVLDWNRRERGNAHPETLSVMHSLANNYIYSHRAEEAAPLVEEIWEITSANYEPSSREALDAMLGLAMLYGRIDRIEEAVVLLQEAVQILRDTRPRIFADTGIYLTHLGIHLNELKRYEEAKAAYVDGYEILSASLGPEAGWTQGTLRFLCDVCKTMGDTEQATVWCGRLSESKDDALQE